MGIKTAKTVFESTERRLKNLNQFLRFSISTSFAHFKVPKKLSCVEICFSPS